jgi:hypothetical protein
VKPFLGLSFAGDTTFVFLDGDVGKNAVVGIGGVWLGEVFGVEGELAHAPGFFQTGSSSLVIESSVTTAMGSVVVAVPRQVARYGLRPYGVGGFGVMHIGFQDTLQIFREKRNLAAMNIGGGATGFINDWVGFSWELRHFRSLGGDRVVGVSLEPEKLSFWRASMAVAIRLTQY